MFTDRLYTGQRQIAELGVYHFNARFYSPKLGRFLSADTLMSGFANPQGLNRFSYVANNPVRYTDPTGHCSLSGHWLPDDSAACIWFNNNSGNTDTSTTPDNGSSNGSDNGEPNIPDPVYNDECEETLLLSCVHPGDDVYTQVAHTVFGEGGAGSQQAAANIMQIMLNRAYVDWTCWETGCSHSYINGTSQIPWENITQEQLVKMMLFVLSEPYGEEAAFNAWTEPYPHYSTGTSYWPDVNNAVTDLINSPVVPPWQSTISVGGVQPAEPIRSDPNVQYYVSFPAGYGPPTQPYVWIDALPGGRQQYYGTYPMDDE